MYFLDIVNQYPAPSPGYHLLHRSSLQRHPFLPFASAWSFLRPKPSAMPTVCLSLALFFLRASERTDASFQVNTTPFPASHRCFFSSGSEQRNKTKGVPQPWCWGVPISLSGFFVHGDGGKYRNTNILCAIFFFQQKLLSIQANICCYF